MASIRRRIAEGIATKRDATRAFVAASIRSKPRSERTYLENALAVANWDGKTLSDFTTAMAQLLDDPSLLGNAGTDLEHERAVWLRDVFRRDLALLLVRNRPEEQKILNQLPANMRAATTSRAVSKPDLARHARGGMALIAEPRLSSGQLEIEYRYAPLDEPAAFDFALLLLAATNRPFGEDLRRCKRPDCGGYFLVSRSNKGGRPREHHEACSVPAHRERSAIANRERRRKQQRRG